MRQGRHGIKVLGLSLIAALGLMAFTAAAAQAGEYKIEGSTLTTRGLGEENVQGTIAAGELLTSLGVTFNCTGGSFSGTVLLGGVAHASVLYSGCTVLNEKFCKTYETKLKMEMEEEPGFITASGLGSLVLMGGEHFLLVSGAPFSTIYLTKSTKGCTQPLEDEVSGSTVLRILESLTEKVTHTLDTIPQAELESLFSTDLLEYGHQVAWLDGGSAEVSLSGVNKTKNWSAE